MSILKKNISGDFSSKNKGLPYFQIFFLEFFLIKISSIYYMELLDFYKRLFVIVIGFLQPIIILLVLGNVESISSIWGTCLEPLFIFVNALTSYFFFGSHKWQISSFLLLMLTSFSVVGFKDFHNILAVLFFISCLYPLYSIKRLRFYIWFYLCSVPMCIFYGLFWAEVVGIYIICIYHIHLLFHLKKFNK